MPAAPAKITFRKFHAEQQRIYRGLSKRTVLRCGRRFGKTTLLEDAAGNWAIRGLKVGWFTPNYKLLLPSYKRILRTIKPVVSSSNRTDATIDLETGGQIEFWTLNDEDAGRSRAYDKVVIDEASLVRTGLRQTWEQAIAPTLLDRRGDAVMAGTPKGVDEENFFHTVCTDKKLGWLEFHAPTRNNPKLDPVGVANLVNEYPPLVYQQEFLAEFVDWGGHAFFDVQRVLVDGQPVAMPRGLDAVFATVDTAVKTGKDNDGTAVIYWGRSAYVGHPLTILDWDIVQIEGGLLETWLPTVFQNLQALAVQCRARMGSLGAHIEDKSSGTILLQQALRRGWDAHAIDSKLTAVGKDERAISVSGYVYRGEVKIAAPPYAKLLEFKGNTLNHLLRQVFTFTIGDKTPGRQDDLLDAFCYGVAIALGNEEGF